MRRTKIDEFLRSGRNIVINANDFNTLACECYVNENCINVYCLKYLESHKPWQGTIVFLPTYSYTLTSHAYDRFLLRLTPYFDISWKNILKILCPLFTDYPKHWGPLYNKGGYPL